MILALLLAVVGAPATIQGNWVCESHPSYGALPLHKNFRTDGTETIKENDGTVLRWSYRWTSSTTGILTEIAPEGASDQHARWPNVNEFDLINDYSHKPILFCKRNPKG